jgi:hypothetical protein
MAEWIPQATRRTWLLVVFTAVLVAVGFAPRDAVALELPPGFSTVEIATGLDGPTALAYAPDGRMFVTEKAGRVRVVDATGRLQAEPVIDISNHVNSYWDRGLLGIAVDAQFVTNHYVYLLYVNETNAIDPTASKTSRLTRIEVTSDNRVAKPDAPETVLLGGASEVPCPPPGEFVDCIPADGFSHSIGTVRADPDGTLWLGSGDASGFWGVDPKAVRTYDENSFAGKLIHIDRDGRGLRGHPFCSTQTNSTRSAPSFTPKASATRSASSCGRGGARSSVTWDGTPRRNSTSPSPAAATDGHATRAGHGRPAIRTLRAAPLSTPPGCTSRRRTSTRTTNPTRRSWWAPAMRATSTRPRIGARGSSPTTRRA